MKKLTVLFAAMMLAIGVFADVPYVINGSLAGTLTPQDSTLATGFSGSAINRGGFALGADGLYFCNGTTGFMSKAPLDLSSIAAETDSIGTGYYMDIDDAGHYIIYAWTLGSSSMDVAQVYNADHSWVRNDTLLLTGRCDMPAAIGNMVEGRGAYFTYSNGVKNVIRHNVLNGVIVSRDTIAVEIATGGGNNSVAPLDVDHFYVQERGSGLAYVDCSGEAPVVTVMSFFGENTFTSAYGGKIFEFAGHKLFVMGTYKVGGYLGSFAVFDVTDPANVYQIAEETSKMGTSAMGTACVTFRVCVEGQTAYIYEYACFSVRKYALTVVPACYLKQGAEGEWVSMDAVNDNFTHQDIYAGTDIFVNGTSQDAGATQVAAANISFNGTVVEKDTVLFTYNPTAGTMVIDSVGHFVPVVKFSVVVPQNTPSCYISGNFNDWGFDRMKQIDSVHYEFAYRAEDAIAENLEYKYVAGTNWDYVEVQVGGGDIANRHWTAADTVAAWKDVQVLNTIAYELNGGVFNDYGWTSKGAVALALQEDYNIAYSSSKEWAKWEDGKYYFKIGEDWMEENAAQGQLCTATGFIQNVTYNTTNNLKTLIETTQVEKYSWLKDVMVAARSAGGLGVTDADLVENAYRKEISAIMLASPAETSWPASANYTTFGTVAAIMPIWKHGFANPTTVTGTFTLNAPYKEGYTFDGWYADDACEGTKVTSIDENTSGTLYAKWVEYISTIAEAVASDSASIVKTAGVVTYVRGRNVYIQDASAAVLLYLDKSNTIIPKVGDQIVVSGKNIIYGGAPEISDAVITKAEAGANLPTPVAFETLGALTSEPLKYFGQRVVLKGLKIAKYDDHNNVWVTDGIDTIQCYNMTPDQAIFPVDKKINLTAIAAYYNVFQFTGDVAGIEIVTVGKVDQYQYPARGENGEYTLVNKWIISNVEDNYDANKPGPNDYVRGMAAKDGKMYFINRNNSSITVVDGASGDMLDPIKITGTHLFERENITDSATMTTAWEASVTLAYNDLKFDNAGNCLIGACVSGNQSFQVYKVDLTTGVATTVVDEHIYANPDFKDNGFRFDAFGVYGDVNGNAIIMAQDANSFNAYKWTIENGVAGPAELIENTIDPTSDVSRIIREGALSVANFGTAPQIFPVDFNYFYVDGWSTLPMLFDMNGVLIDDFINCPTGAKVFNNVGDTCTMNEGHNGLVEFQVGDEYFLLMAATNTAGKPTSSFALYKFADAAKAFDGLEPLWYFPANGMGAATNGCRTAVPSVEVNGNKATLYLYTNNNGYGVYEFTGTVGTGLEKANVKSVESHKLMQNGRVYIMRNGIRYNVLGVVE